MTNNVNYREEFERMTGLKVRFYLGMLTVREDGSYTGHRVSASDGKCYVMETDSSGRATRIVKNRVWMEERGW